MKYKVIKILKKQILGEFENELTLEEMRDLAIKTFGEDKNIVIFQLEESSTV